jgi:hypothetical protein
MVHMTIFKIKIIWILFFCAKNLLLFLGVGVHVSVYVVSCVCFVLILCLYVFKKKFNIIQI